MSKVHSASDFRCQLYEPIFKSVLKSYSEEKTKEVLLDGGSSSGKSMHVSNEIIFWLTEEEEARALLIVYSTRHKEQTKQLICSLLDQYGYTHTTSSYQDGTNAIRYGNKNVIEIMSVQTSSLDNLEEKFKTGVVNKKLYKFIWFEEFTAILTAFRTLGTFYSAKSRLMRLIKNNAVIFYTLNPPNKRHIFWNWKKEYDGLNIFSTIYMLPKKFQDKNTLLEAEKLKSRDLNAYKTIYLGERLGEDGLAFSFTEDIWCDFGDYIRYIIQTDEASVNASSIGIYGVTKNYEIHRITGDYVKAKNGHLPSPSYLAKRFKGFVEELGLKNLEIGTDGLAFSLELRDLGVKASSIGKIKNRELSYYLLNKLILEGKFKIVKDDTNVLFYNQLANAEKEYSGERAFVSKKKETSAFSEEFHCHDLDTALYICLREQKNILKGERWKSKTR